MGNTIQLSSIPSGEYQLELRGRNSKGVWSNTIKIDVEVLKPWYARWWAIALLVLAVASLIRAIVRYRVEQIKKMERLKNRISSDLHDEIGSSLTSLNIYNNLAYKYSNEKGQGYLKRSETVLQGVIDSLNDIVWSLNSRNESVHSLVDRVRNASVLEALRLKGCEVEISTKNVDKVVLSNEQRKNLLLCIKEACNNCLKYAQATKLIIKIEGQNKYISTTIVDNGTGFEISSSSTGNGLLNMQERMNAIDGDIVLQSTPTKGTSLLLHFPM
jgi:signal transduction histidine kinase